MLATSAKGLGSMPAKSDVVRYNAWTAAGIAVATASTTSWRRTMPAVRRIARPSSTRVRAIDA